MDAVDISDKHCKCFLYVVISLTKIITWVGCGSRRVDDVLVA